MLFLIVFLLLITIVIAFFSSAKGKGIMGEWAVKLVLGKNKQDKQYVINNFMITIDEKSSKLTIF